MEETILTAEKLNGFWAYNLLTEIDFHFSLDWKETCQTLNES